LKPAEDKPQAYDPFACLTDDGHLQYLEVALHIRIKSRIADRG
jgi:hypothetical protein